MQLVMHHRLETATVNADSTVLVLGLGAIASVTATDTKSMFTVNLDRLDAFKDP